MLQTWSTPSTPHASFIAAWEDVIRAGRSAHFAYRPDYLAWEAKHSHVAEAAIVDGGPHHGAILLEREGPGWICGRPWRTGALVGREPAPRSPIDLTREEAEWLFRAATQLANGRRLRMYLPYEPPAGVPGYYAGITVHQDIAVSDDELLQAMAQSKRRMVRKAQERGYAVRDAAGLDDMRAYHALSIETRKRRNLHVDESSSTPEPGTSWREWELPWMWLILAEREGRLEAGAGDSIGPGWTLEARTAASTLDARRDGAFALLCWEEARRARDRGLRWLNHGGNTPFKREIAGKLGHAVTLWCWMSGSLAWALPNAAEAMLVNLRQHARHLRASLRKSR